MKSFIMFVVLMLTMATTACATPVKFTWDQHGDPAVVKYTLYESTSATAPKPWSSKTVITGRTTVTTTINNYSGTYFWYLTASSSTQESTESNIVTTTLAVDAPVMLKFILP